MEAIKKTMTNLERNGFHTRFFSAKEDALDWLLTQVEKGQTATSGGSMTLEAMELGNKLEAKGVNFIRHGKPYGGQSAKDIDRLAFSADVYFSSANAITEDGYIFNVDGSGNRVAALSFGPDRVFIVAGRNKICKDTEAAYKRNEEIAAPLNCRRLQKNTPCNHTGTCSDCDSPERICRIYTLMKRAPADSDMTVVIIDEDLGY